ncbi:hypothetical protein QYE76_013654 [Lolium multiflorum]|uniref:non-specific serine/threonine protein kinase n=1 Tax=Lolium multiflorum TaxID=4521 RepID=A0AAD8U3C9_LOLMU|nr:hypothetical protein QYE76_013654 [Lolium multiflorum]
MDLMKTVYVAIDEEKPEPPVCLVRGLSVQGTFLDDILLRVTGMKASAVYLGVKRGVIEIKQHPFSEGVNWDLIHCSTPPEVPRPVEAELPMKYMMPVAIASVVL